MTAPQQIEGGELDLFKRIGLDRVPFKSTLSFRPLIDHLLKYAEKNGPTHTALVRHLVEALDAAPEFYEPITDPEILNKYPETFDLLISAILPPVLRETRMAKIASPFNSWTVYQTPPLRQLSQRKDVKPVFNRSSNIIYCATIVGACSLILNKFYGQNIQVDPPFAVSLRFPDSPIERHYKTQLDLSFVDIIPLKPLKKLSQVEINHLLSNIYDIDLWLEHIPPENFEFQGFILGQMVDITEEEALSRLKYRLLRKDAVISQDSVKKLECLIRSYLNVPELRLGITAIDYPLETMVSHRYKIRFDFLAETQSLLLSNENAGSIYEKACKYREVLLIEELENLPNKTSIEKGLLQMGIRSIILAPLFNKKEQVIGILEIGSSKPYHLHSFIELKFKEIIGLFSLAIERSREEIDNQIEAIIREQFTAVHSSVEWRFVEAAYNLLEKRERNIPNATMEPIVFENVCPLYGQADIVNSSNQRNQAIQIDLIDNLKQVRQTMHRLREHVEFPLLDQLILKTETNLKELEAEFNSNDESRILNLLHQEIHPVLRYFRERYSDLAGQVSRYFDYLDPQLQTVYRARKAYEESVTQLNNAIAGYLDKQEKKTQQILPHYFEKYKTDGVEYDMYFGQSLLRMERFSQMHLKNFRLWQLIDMVEITRLVHRMQGELPQPLTTTQLVFAYTTPLSIRFRMDEKQFDVDGAYNVRYEILKKRIDKAVIEGTNERVTVPGKVAIIYLQEEDRQEYLDYLKYLQQAGYTEGEIEDLKLQKLQGAQGLRALRFTVKM